MTAPLFRSEGARYSYDGVVALNGVDLEIGRGERVALLGANGSGKSTFLHLLDALVFAEEGTVAFDGAALTRESMGDERVFAAFRRRVGLVFQNPDVQIFNASVFDEIAFGPLQLGWPKERVIEKVRDAMTTMTIETLAQRPPHRLSVGEKKRVAIASVLVVEPEVLLLDEPTSALDPGSQSRVIDLLLDWTGDSRTAVVATHDLGIVEDVADRCVVFQDGRVVADAAPKEILANESLLKSTGLLHAHRHRHESGVVHSHPHVHRHGEHEH